MGPKTRGSRTVKHDIQTPTTAPPSKRVKQLAKNPSPEAPSASTPESAEEVLHYSGRIKRSLADGPVSLFPYENKRAEGGFAVQVRQKGVIIGLISYGEELKCRKLLVVPYEKSADYYSRTKAGKANCDASKRGEVRL